MSRRRNDLVRWRFAPDAVELRAGDPSGEGTGRTLFGHFAVFDTWTRIHEWGGDFMERIAPGAFDDVFKNYRGTRILFQHGRDPQIGSKPIAGVGPDTLRSDEIGGYYEAELFDTRAVDEILPALQFDPPQLGASFRFSIATDGDEWVEKPRESDYNPERLPERTIRSVDYLPDVGPVTYGAYDAATAGVRSGSGTDEFVDQLLHDPLFLARFVERVGLPNVERILAEVPEADRTDALTPHVAQQGTSGVTPGEREAFFRSLTLT